MLPRDRRLTSRRDITAVVRGRRIGTPSLVVHALPCEVGQRPRFAMAINKGVGGAVVRNRVARRIRHLLAADLPRWDAVGVDVVVRALPPAGAADSAALGEDLRYCLAQLQRTGP